MAMTKEFIENKYMEAIKTIYNDENEWEKFLTVAGRNFKLRFDEQILIYAQRPDATAVLEIEKWNKLFHRWVNKGAKGIAVFDTKWGNSQKIKHYFDVSDTHEGRNPMPVPIWEMKPEYEEEIKDVIESVYGELEKKDTFADVIRSASENGAEDNFESYFEELIERKYGSFLEELDDDNIKVMFRELLSESIAFTLSKRLNVPVSNETITFQHLSQFNTKSVLQVLGNAVSDISEMGLIEISKTILALDNKNRTIDEKESKRYTDENKEERRSGNEGNHLHKTGRFSDSGSDNAGAGGNGTGILRNEEKKLPEGEQETILLRSSDGREAMSGTLRNRAEGNKDGREPDRENESRGRNNGRTEETGHDAMGSENEQSDSESKRDSSSGSSIRLEHYEKPDGPQELPWKLYQNG